MRDDLIRVATELLELPQVVEAPSLRRIASATGVAPSAVYTRFESGEELLQAVIDHQYASLRDEVRKSVSLSQSAIENLEAIATTYVNWGIQHPGLYQLLFESADQLPVGLVANGPGLELLAEIAPLVAKQSGCSAEVSQHATMRLWAALHGITSLRIHKKHARWSTEAGEEASATVRALLAWLQ